MAFKRYAALLAGSALIGSLTFVQPAMAQENTESTQCVRTVEEIIQVKAGTVENPFRNWRGFVIEVRSADVAGIPDAVLVNGNAEVLKFTVPEDTATGDYTVTLYPAAGVYKQDETLTVTLEDKTVEKEEKFDCATITVDDVTVTTGKTTTVDAVIEDGASDLKVTAPEGLTVTVGENNKITVDATGAEVKTYTVPFTYQAEGTDETQNGTFEVTVEKKKDENAFSNFLGSFKGLSSK